LNGTVQPNCADVPLRNYSLTHYQVQLHNNEAKMHNRV